MLSQTGGTLGQPADLGDYTDARHYRLPQPEGAHTVRGVLTLSPPGGGHHLLAFTSCRRLRRRFDPPGGAVQGWIAAAGLSPAPWGAREREGAWEVEGLVVWAGRDGDERLPALARRLEENPPRLGAPAPPSGWCSWYCFGPRVTAAQVLANLDVIARTIPGLKYIQIDDGYQAAMGDWLETGEAFGGGVGAVLRQIRERGFAPALWVAPFLAARGARLAPG